MRFDPNKSILIDLTEEADVVYFFVFVHNTNLVLGTLSLSKDKGVARRPKCHICYNTTCVRIVASLFCS